MQLLFKPDMASEEPLKTLSSDYLSLLTEGQAFSDVIFCVEGKRVHAHRCILAARSTFFRTLFCNSDGMAESEGSSRVIPVGIVGYDVFLTILQFLYSGQLLLASSQHNHARKKCHERACWHTSCSSSVELALDTLHGAHYFGVDQLSILIQKHLASLVEKASIEDVMKVLMVAKKQELHHLWITCSELVARSGLTQEALKKHVPLEVVREIEDVRTQRGYNMQGPLSNGRECGSMEEQRVRKMQQALDSFDVELVRLIVMSEGLNLDKANALHYAVANCSREVVKALLEMGAVDVNYLNMEGKAALHIASEMASPEMIAVLLDHHASPQVRTSDGASPLDIVQALAMAQPPAGKLIMAEHNSKLRLCLELLQSAAIVAAKEDEPCEGVMTEVSDDLVDTTAAADQNDVQGFSLEPDNYSIFCSNLAKSSLIPNGSSLDGFLSVYNPGLPGTSPASVHF